MIGWRVFGLASTDEGHVLCAPLAARAARLSTSVRLFPSRGPELVAQCPRAGHRPPEPGCGCGLYFFSAAIPAAVRRRGCRYPVIAEVETYGPVLVDPLVTPEDSSGNAQRAAVLRLTQLWVMPDVPPVVRAELERYWTPVDVWRPEGDRQAIDAFVARKPGVGR